MSAIPDGAPDTGGRRKRLVALCRSLPEASVERADVDHLAFLCKAPPGEQGRLVKEDPVRYFVPPYVERRGWVGLRLDTPRVNWREVKNLAFAAYVLTAPDSLRKTLR